MACEIFSHYHSSTNIASLNEIKVSLFYIDNNRLMNNTDLIANVKVQTLDENWILKKTLYDFISLEHIHQRCNVSREISQITNFKKAFGMIKKINYEKYFEIIEASFPNICQSTNSSYCYSFLNWFELDFKGQRNRNKGFVMMNISNPFPPLCSAVEKYEAISHDEISIQIGSSLYIYDFNAVKDPSGNSTHWAGKLLCGNDNVMLFPCNAVAIITDKAYDSNFNQENVIQNKNAGNKSLKELFLNRSKTLLGLEIKQKEKMFGIDLREYLISKKMKIPPLLIYASKQIEQRGYDVTGIYRISAQQSAVTATKDKIENDIESMESILADCDVNIVSSLLKNYFRNLPCSLINEENYERLKPLIANNNPENLKQFKHIIKHFHQLNYCTLEYLLRHLKRMIRFEEKTKMTVENMATVWGPNLSISKSDQVNVQQELFYQTNIVKYLLINYSYIFETHSTNSNETTLKEGMNKINDVDVINEEASRGRLSTLERKIVQNCVVKPNNRKNRPKSEIGNTVIGSSTIIDPNKLPFAPSSSSKSPLSGTETSPFDQANTQNPNNASKNSYLCEIDEIGNINDSDSFIFPDPPDYILYSTHISLPESPLVQSVNKYATTNNKSSLRRPSINILKNLNDSNESLIKSSKLNQNISIYEPKINANEDITFKKRGSG